MGLFDGLLGNASEINHEEARKQLEEVLLPNEPIDLAYKLVRDLIVFTDKRLIIVDKQGVSGKKVDYKSIPFKSISRFSVETSGHFDLDAELHIYISSAMTPSETLTFKKNGSITVIQQALALAVLSN